jgi:WD40 repeat protein
VWDCESWECIRKLKGHSEITSSVCITPDGSRAISASWDETIRIWNLENGCSYELTEGHSDTVNSISIAPSGEFAISSSWDKTLKVWNLENYNCVRTLQGHKNPVMSVSIHPNGRQAMSASYDKTLRMWNLKDGQELFSLDASTISVLCVDIAPDGRRAVSSGDDGFIHLWDIETGRHLMSQMNQKFGVRCVKFTPDGQNFVWGSDDAVLRIDTTDYLKYKDPSDIPIELHGHSDWISDLSLTPDGRFVVSASKDGSLCFWDIKSGLLLRKIHAHSKRITGVKISSDGRLAFSVSWDHSLRMWNLDNGECVAVFVSSTTLESVAICPKTSFLLCGTFDGEIIFFKNPMISLGLKAIKKNTLQEYSTDQSISGHNGVQNYPFELVLSEFAAERQLTVVYKRINIDFYDQKYESMAGTHAFWRKDYEKKYSSEPYLDFRKHIRFGGYEIINESVDDRSRFEFNVALYLEKNGKKFSVLYKAIHEAPQVGWSVSIHLFDEDLCNNDGNKANARRAYERYLKNTHFQDNLEKWKQLFEEALSPIDRKTKEQLNYEAAEKAFKEENWDVAYNLYLKLVQQGQFDINYMRYNMAICRLNSLTSNNQEIIHDIDILIVRLKGRGANDKAQLIADKLKERLDAIKQEELARKKALPWWKKIF